METEKEIPEAKLNKFKDIVCPSCGLNMITPDCLEIKSGAVGKCLNCGKPFRTPYPIA